MNSSQITIMATIIAYLCFVIITGIMIGRRSKKSAEGFYLGGRGMGPLVTAMSAEASDMSSWLLMGLPGVAYLSGVADAGWTAIGLAVGAGMYLTAISTTFFLFLVLSVFAKLEEKTMRKTKAKAEKARHHDEMEEVILCMENAEDDSIDLKCIE